MTAAATTTGRFDIGRVMSRTFGVIGRNLVVFGVLSVALAGVPQGIARYFSQSSVLGTGGLNAALISVLAGLLSFIGANILQAAVIQGSISDLNGKRANLDDCIATGLKFMLPVIGISILTAFALAAGFILLIVPGLMMAVAWCVNVPVVVVERKGVFEAFGRSADLTRGHRWAIFGLMVIYGLVVWIVDAVAMASTAGFSLAGMARAASFNGTEWVVLTVLQIIQSLIAAAGVASIYYELRSTKDGIGPESLAAVFD
ncbi:MAG TPA: hypothetical protein VHX64_07775 [Caulobacteraceae bacterium]|nr:hypothetical protein [Caulobacteraceae bacterium]